MFLGDRLVGCAIVSGPAPPEAKVSKDAMLRPNRIAQRLAPVTPGLLSLAVAVGLRRAQRAPDAALAWMSRTLPACDAAVIERPEVRAALRADLARRPASTAARAAIQDLQAELKSWGFPLADIAVPVHVWHGDLDRNVQNAGFFPAFFLTPVVWGATAWEARRHDRGRAARVFAAAAITYLAGALIVTMAINVPMNDDLANEAIPTSTAEAQKGVGRLLGPVAGVEHGAHAVQRDQPGARRARSRRLGVERRLAPPTAAHDMGRRPTAPTSSSL
jgi:Domain of unknown function (DUF1772)